MPGVKGAAQAPFAGPGQSPGGGPEDQAPGSSWILMIWYALKSISWTLNLTNIRHFDNRQERQCKL
jgi:hypothetical protein